MEDQQVLIVGAGPTGLVLALWLAMAGVRVRIIDKTLEPAAFSRALGVQARTLEFYRQMGIADAVLERGIRVTGINFWVKGSRAARVSVENIGEALTPFPYILDFAQHEHERLLIAQLEASGVRVERGVELIRMDPQRQSVRVTLKQPAGSEEISEAEYLAGCDGAHSAVREGLSVGFPGGTYTQLFYVADVEAGGLADDDEVHVDLDEADLLAVFPMRGKNRVRLVGTVREEAQSGRGELTFADVSEHVTKSMKLTIEKVNWFSPYHVHHRVAQSFRQGRVFLLGDAAHIHSPVGAQGMNTGIGDAVNLAWKLAAVLRDGATDRLLDSYEPERISFARRLVATTDRLFTIASQPGTVAARVRTRLIPRIAPALMRLDPVRRFLFRTVSQTALRYPRSILSTGVAGRVRGGDRLPWVQYQSPSAAMSDNFECLASLAWQVHCYGEAVPAIQKICDARGLAYRVFPWNSAPQEAGLKQDAAYIVRPDGYVGLADADANPEAISAYLDEWTSRGY